MIVEAALVLPLLFLIVFGMIDFGVTLSDQISVREGVREGARQAVVTAPGSTGAPQDSVVVPFTKERIGVKGAQTRVRLVPEPLRKADGTVEIQAGQPGSYLTVCAYVPMRSLSGLFSPLLDGRYTFSKVTMRVEQPLPYTDERGDPDDPTGANWSSCHV